MYRQAVIHTKESLFRQQRSEIDNKINLNIKTTGTRETTNFFFFFTWPLVAPKRRLSSLCGLALKLIRLQKINITIKIIAHFVTCNLAQSLVREY